MILAPQNSNPPDYTGLAALLTAVGGMAIGLTTLVFGELRDRRKKADVPAPVPVADSDVLDNELFRTMLKERDKWHDACMNEKDKVRELKRRLVKYEAVEGFNGD